MFRVAALGIWHLGRQSEAYDGLDVRDTYQGLDAKLGYPSIDFAEIGWLGGRDAGDTEVSNGEFNNYVVFLPEDLGQLGITSLPAKTTAPKRQGERAQTMS